MLWVRVAIQFARKKKEKNSLFYIIQLPTHYIHKRARNLKQVFTYKAKQAKQEPLCKLLRNKTYALNSISFSGFFAWVFRFFLSFWILLYVLSSWELGASFLALSTFQNFRSSFLPVFPSYYFRPVFPSRFPSLPSVRYFLPCIPSPTSPPFAPC